jgi:mannan endo-1,4-beta-mannosidase
LWAFSPADVKTEQEYLERYPGDEFVDIIGFDTYAGKNTPEQINDYVSKIRTNLDIVTSLAKKHDKIPILAETGNESISIPGFFTKVLLPVIKDYKISYVLFWRNAFRSDMRHHFYVPFDGHQEAGDFKAFTDLERILLNKDINNIYNDNF